MSDTMQKKPAFSLCDILVVVFGAEQFLPNEGDFSSVKKLLVFMTGINLSDDELGQAAFVCALLLKKQSLLRYLTVNEGIDRLIQEIAVLHQPEDKRLMARSVLNSLLLRHQEYQEILSFDEMYPDLPSERTIASLFDRVQVANGQYVITLEAV